MKLFKRRSKKAKLLDLLRRAPHLMLTAEERVAMTISCRDTDYIPKVEEAGQVRTVANRQVQIMHNGLQVIHGGYYDEWMARIIEDLKGHHEPQEEKVFYEVLKRIGPEATMIELGSFWAYYSLWFHQQISNAKNVCCEPDPTYRQIGVTNAELNQADLVFVASAAGDEDGKEIRFTTELQPRQVLVPIRSVDSLCREYGLDRLTLLHMDVQGAELAALRGAGQLIAGGGLRFVFVSTHHYSISGEPTMHRQCLDFIKQHGGHVIIEHEVYESFSGDGLIVASFAEEDRDFKVQVSCNRMRDSLFRDHTEDLAILLDYLSASSFRRNPYS